MNQRTLFEQNTERYRTEWGTFEAPRHREQRETRKGQKSKILAHLESGKSITDDEARELYGCKRLAARINDLRKEGHRITTETVTATNGNDCARYWMGVPR